jgi:hypothetical protein
MACGKCGEKKPKSNNKDGSFEFSLGPFKLILILSIFFYLIFKLFHYLIALIWL